MGQSFEREGKKERMLMQTVRSSLKQNVVLDLPMVESLLKKGANVNYKDENNDTPLMVAVTKNDIELVKLLCKYGADPNVQSHRKEGPEWTAIFEACKRGYFDCVKILLENGALVNISNSDGWTPLMFVCDAYASECTEIVKLLLTYGAQLHFKDHRTGSTALFIAVTRGDNADVVETLINHSPQIVNDQTMNNGQTPLQRACENGHFKSAEVLLKHGAHVDQQNEKGVTALIYAAARGDHRIMKLLLEHGANVSLLECDGLSALMYSCIVKRNEKNIKLLLDHGANVDQQLNNKGWTALMIASLKGNADNAKVLLDHGAQVDLQTLIGHRQVSPLMIACSKGFTKVAMVLFEHGAQVNFKDSDGRTPLMEARLNGHKDVVAMLLEHGAQEHPGRLDDSTHSQQTSLSLISIETVAPLHDCLHDQEFLHRGVHGQLENAAYKIRKPDSVLASGSRRDDAEYKIRKPVPKNPPEADVPPKRDFPVNLTKALELFLPLAARWEAIGLQLGLEGVLSTIRHNHHTKEDCLRATLQKWFEVNPSPTWQALTIVESSIIRDIEKLEEQLFEL